MSRQMFVHRASLALRNAARRFADLSARVADDMADDDSLLCQLARADRDLEEAAVAFVDAARDAGEHR